MTPYKIGIAIRKARGDRSLREVAEAAGVNKDQIMSIESASTNYTIETLTKVAKEVGCAVVIQTLH